MDDKIRCDSELLLEIFDCMWIINGRIHICDPVEPFAWLCGEDVEKELLIRRKQMRDDVIIQARLRERRKGKPHNLRKHSLKRFALPPIENNVSIIAEYVKLQLAGQNFKGRCPFHKDKSPSFVVNVRKNVWHCYSCGKGGDAVSFVMELKELTYKKAVEYLHKKQNTPGVKSNKH